MDKLAYEKSLLERQIQQNKQELEYYKMSIVANLPQIEEIVTIKVEKPVKKSFLQKILSFLKF